MKQQEALERLLFVSHVRSGSEAEARKAVEQHFPKDALERAGLVGFTVYIGGGYCIFEFGFEGEFDTIFERMKQQPSIMQYFEQLGSYVTPIPFVQPGATASQPIAADVFLWRIGEEPVSREARARRSRS